MSKHHHRRHSVKKAAVVNSRQSWLNPMKLIVGSVVVATIAAVFFYFSGASVPLSDTISEADATKTIVSYPVNMFADGKARHFEYKTDGLTIRYFILKSSDTIIRAAFDACDVCWPAGKGYYQDGDDMVCRNCGRRFASVRINEVKGGCNPAPLTRNVKGDQLVLKVEDIRQGKNYFDFKRGA